MRVLWIICVIFLQSLLNVGCDELDDDNEFVTIWAPKSVHERRPYNVIVLPTNVIDRAEMSLEFRNSFGTITLAKDKLQKITIKNERATGSKKNLDLTMTVYREVRSKSQPQCSTKVLQRLDVIQQHFYIFIQLDKPIYKPGDKVQFRIILIDKDMKPFHFNNILVQIFDPFNRIIENFNDPGEMFVGIFNSSLKLNPVTPLGEWTIRVVVDKKPQYSKSKKFQVQKYTLPPFETHVKIRNNHMLVNSVVQLKVFAKYSFGSYVRGHFDLTITGVGNDTQTYHSQRYTNDGGVLDINLKIKDELKIKTTSKVPLNITAVYTEPESGIIASKSISCTIHAKLDLQFKAIYPENFYPGSPFGVKVFITKWNGEVILKPVETVRIKYNLVYENENTQNIEADVVLENSVAIHNFVVPDMTVSMTLKINYIKIEHERKIPAGNSQNLVGVNEIKVEHNSKNVKYNDVVPIYVRGRLEMDSLIVLVMTRFGNVESHFVKCDYQIFCNFDVKISKTMLPESKIVVYSVHNERTMQHGETVIKTQEISSNMLEIDLPKTANTKTNISMQFTTKNNSRVYLLAFDKRLTFLASGNEVTRDDVITEVADYDGTNKVTIFDMEEWNDCEPDELKRVKKGRALISAHGGETFTMNDDDTFDEAEFEVEDKQPQVLDDAEDGDNIREYFPETWLYNDFSVDANVTNKTFLTTDSITSWMIYGFSVNDKSGLAISNPKELTVRNQFFMKLHLPYSIRYNETLRLDVMVHNYAESQKTLTVKVDLYNQKGVEFDIIDYKGCVQTGRRSTLKETKTVTVPYDTVKRVSFHIQPNLKTVSAQKTFEKITKIIVQATAEADGEETLKDKVLKKLRVEPIGVKIYDITNKNYRLNSKRTMNDEKSFVLTDTTSEYPRAKLAISGDFLSDAINMETKFEIYPHNCLEQRTSKIKGNVEFLRYLKTKVKNPPTQGFSSYYQSLLMERTQNWNYRNTAGFRAYFIEAIATAMEIKALPMHTNLIERELDAIKSFQDSQGKFTNFGSVPESDRDPDTANYFQTAYVLIPFLRFRSNLTKSYDDVINRGISYLKGHSNKLKLKRQALSIAAYAFALNNDKIEAEKLLKTVETDFIRISRGEKCYKFERSSQSCDLRHTSYTAIAYIVLNQTDDAKQAIAWLLQTHNMNKYYSNTHPYAIATEAIAKYVSTMNTTETKFSVKVMNDGKFDKTFHVNKTNVNMPIEIDLPDYSLAFNTSASGTGFCSITTLIEKTVTVDVTNSKFTLKLTPKTTSSSTEKVIQVCASYNPGQDLSAYALVNVIYDVKIPSGYNYVSIADYDKKPEIKLVETREHETRIQIYYNDFIKEKDYCVDVRAKKIFHVQNMKNAGVMVYDYDNKNNIAVGFYAFADTCN